MEVETERERGGKSGKEEGLGGNLLERGDEETRGVKVRRREEWTERGVVVGHRARVERWGAETSEGGGKPVPEGGEVTC